MYDSNTSKGTNIVMLCSAIIMKSNAYRHAALAPRRKLCTKTQQMCVNVTDRSILINFLLGNIYQSVKLQKQDNIFYQDDKDKYSSLRQISGKIYLHW